jgi:hypothetical protein
MLLAAVVALNPLGLDIIYAAFFSGEALSRNIWGPIVLIGIATGLLVAVLEWRIRVFIVNRRSSGKTTA